MATPLEIINRSGGRAPVTVYRGTPAAAPRRRAAPTRRTRQQPGGPPRTTGRINWAEVEAEARSTPAAQEHIQKRFQEQAEAAAPPQEEQGGFWGSDFGKGLGFVINNPVTRTVSLPLNMFQIGGRALALGREEAAEGLQDAPAWLQGVVGAIPVAGDKLRRVDTERTEADTRTNLSKVFSPTSTYGHGELLPDVPSGSPAWMEWASRGEALSDDIMFDPLTYVGGGATRAVTGATQAQRAATNLARAEKALEAAKAYRYVDKASGEELMSLSRITRAEDAAAAARKTAEAMALDPAAQRVPQFQIPTPRNRAERANLLAELSQTEAGRVFLAGPEAARAGERGFQTISPYGKQLLGIAEPGLRIRGTDVVIPGTRTLARGLNAGGGALRAGVSKIPAKSPMSPMNLRTPKGLEEPYGILTRGREGDLPRAAAAVAGRNPQRVGHGAMQAAGNQVLREEFKELKKGRSTEQIRRLVTEAETTPDANPINRIGARLLEAYQDVTGRVIEPQYLRDPNTYYPWVLDPKWRRVLAKLSKNPSARGHTAANDFIRRSGMHTDELLENNAFYVDNTLDGSGFLEKARQFGPDPITGEPRTFDIGGVDVTFSKPGVDHANEQLHKAFPEWKGDFYDTDPARVFNVYTTSLARQAARDFAEKAYVEAGTPLVRTMTGDLEATRQAINQAEAQQGAAPILSTAQGRYDPTQPLPPIPQRPIVPGSVDDRARRAAVEGAQASAQQANVPEEAAAFAAEAAAMPQPTQRIGDIKPEDFFVTTKGETATAARDADVTRSRTYARAAAAELNAAEKKVRQALATIHENLITPLRTSIKQTEQEIGKVNTRLKKWRAAITEFGPMTEENVDDLTILTTKIEEQILNAETKLKRTAATWKGRATKAQRKSEADLRASLRQLKEVRDQAYETARTAPARMRQEYEERVATLMKPVRDAQEALLRAEMAVPVPVSQTALEAARETIEGQIGNVSPDVLRERYQGIIDDMRTGALATVHAAATDTPEHTRLRQNYGNILKTLNDLLKRPRRKGNLSKANQKLLDQALAARNQLALALGRGLPAGQSPYEIAQFEILRLSDELSRYGTQSLEQQLSTVAVDGALEGFGTRPPNPQRMLRETVEGFEGLDAEVIEDSRAALDRALREMIPINVDSAEHLARRQRVDALSDDDLMKFIGQIWERLPRDTTAELEQLGWRSLGPDRSDLPGLRRQLERYEAMFRPGGRHYAEMGARDTLVQMRQYETAVGKATGDQRRALTAAENEMRMRQEAIIWGNRAKTRRIYGEDEGFGPGEIRDPESITSPPQRKAFETEEPIPPFKGRKIAGKKGEPTEAYRQWAEHWNVPLPEQPLPPVARATPTTAPPRYLSDEGNAAFRALSGVRPDEMPAPKQPLRSVPQPRTEVEALEALKGAAEYGTPTTRRLAEAAEAKGIETDIAQATLRPRIEQANEEIAAKMAAQADLELGPVAQRAEILKKLNNDLTDKTNLVAKRRQAQQLRDRLKDNRPKTTRNVGRVLEEIGAVARANPLLDDANLAATESLLHTHREELMRIGEGRLRVADLDRIAEDAANGKLGDVMIATNNNSWRALRRGPLREGSVLMDAELYRMHNNLYELHRQPRLVGRLFNEFTNLFKTYATLSPGFFIRNAIGGVFMNTADGVTLTAQIEGLRAWQKWMKGGKTWLEQQPQRTQDAFYAAWASGAGGRYEDIGVAAGSTTNKKWIDWMSSNRATRFAQRFGTRVEGSMRLGMAFDSIDRGDDVQRALQRITRVHFDYNQISELDDFMKQIIPFWTFMSRNLPLQIQEMWTNPRVYSYYDHVVNNFSMEDEEFTPEYWTRQGAWRTPIEIGGMPIYAQPDLGFTRVQQDIDMLGKAVTGDTGLLLSQLNPALGATTDYLYERDSFYDRQFKPTDYSERSGLVGTPISWLARAASQTNEAGQVSDNFTNYLQSLIPPLNQAMRLAPETSGGSRTADTYSKWARYFGVPTQLLTPAAKDSEFWRQWREMQDEMDRQRAMAIEAAS